MRPAPLSLSWRIFFETGVVETKGEDGLDIFLASCHRKMLAASWEIYRSEIMKDWISNHPGTKPFAWWECDAPRWQDPFEGVYFHGTLPEPRLRIGGVGTPHYEVLAYVPDFDKGIPTGWVSKSQEEYYNGRSVDIRGNKTNQKWPPGSGYYQEGDFEGKAIDPSDPPIFESEASYLERHGLLSPQEKKYLASHPEAMEPEMVNFEEEER